MIQKITILSDMAVVQTVIAYADKTNSTFTNRITTFFLKQKYKFVFKK